MPCLFRLPIAHLYLEVGYLNCHGTSTPAGDMAEVGHVQEIASDLGQNASEMQMGGDLEQLP